jgi:two-component system CheB/CheR fusion protein
MKKQTHAQNGKTSGPDSPAVLTQKNRLFPILGIGGSAGSFKALERFFMHMPVDSGVALVIIMHLDPNHSIKVSELLQKYTSMPVRGS